MNSAISPVAALALLLAMPAGPPQTAGPAGSCGKAVTNARIIDEAQLKAEREKHAGRVVVLHIWATWCGPCVAELPLLARLAREARRRGIDLLPVSLDEPTEESAAHVGRLLAARTGDAQWSPILRVSDPDALLAGLDPRWEGEIPVSFAFDREGKLRRTFIGSLGRADFERLVADLVAPARK